MKEEKVVLQDFTSAKEKAKGFTGKKNDFLLLIEMLRDVFKGNFSLSFWSVLVIIGALIYLISPIDIIPDIIPIIGWLDDVGIISFAVSRLNSELSAYKKFKEVV